MAADGALTKAARGAGHVLIVEPDVTAARPWVAALRERGLEVAHAGSGAAALAFITVADRLLDAVVTDLDLPDQSGIDLLRQIRSAGTDVPTILLTAQPTIRTAIEAVECRAHGYLTLPLDLPSLLESVEKAVAHSRVARMREEALALVAMAAKPALGVQVERALDTMWFAYQPIVDRDHNTCGYEALLRNEEPDLRNPLALIEAAEQLGRAEELTERVWRRAPGPMIETASDRLLFMNVDPGQLRLVRTLSGEDELAGLGERIVLEVTERAVTTSVPHLAEEIRHLKGLGFRIAVDDLGAAYSGMSSFAQLDPDYVKLDGTLIRALKSSDRRYRLISGIIGLCEDLGIEVVAEGIETPEEMSALMDLGCHMFQGFLVGMPGAWGG